MSPRAMAALIMTAVSIVVLGLAAILLTLRTGETSIFDLETGSCFELPAVDELEPGATFDLAEVEVVACGDPHDAEVVATGLLNAERDRPYPSDDELFAEADQRCGVEVTLTTDRFGVVPIVPNEQSWEPLQGEFLCLAVPFGGGPVTESILDDDAGS